MRSPQLHSKPVFVLPSYLRAAMEQNIESPCKACKQWPRRNGFKLCSGNECRNPSLPSQVTPNLAVGTHQQEWQGPYGYPPSARSSSHSRGIDPPGAPGTGGGSNFYSNPGVQPHPGGHTVTNAQPQGSSATGYGEGFQDHGPLSISPGNHPINTHSKRCA